MAVNSDEPEKIRKPSSQSNRCYICNKNLKLMPFTCKCSHNFCNLHRYPDTHNCEFDFKAQAKEQLKKANPIINPEKIKNI
jgi:predicted nucleic acid binding AN1-type Zn finger protein